MNKYLISLSLMVLSLTVPAYSSPWQQAIDQFNNQTEPDVLSSYISLVKQLNRLPSQRRCITTEQQKIDQALVLNPSSLIAHTLRYQCQRQNNQVQQAQQTREQIEQLAQHLIADRTAETPHQAIEIRELLEAPLLLQYLGFHILDVDLIQSPNRLYYRYHVLDLSSFKSSVRYFSNSHFMKQLLAKPEVSDEVITKLTVRNYSQQQSPMMQDLKAQQLMIDGDFDRALQLLLNNPEDSLRKLVLMSQIYLITEQAEQIKPLLNQLILPAKAGYIPAAVVLAHYYHQQQQVTIQQQWLATVDQYTKPGEGAYLFAQANRQLQGDEQMSLNWYRIAAQQQHASALLILAGVKLNQWRQQPSARNQQQALTQLKQAQQAGSKQAVIELAKLYQQSDEPQLQQQGIILLQQLAEQQHPAASHLLGYYYQQGIQVTANIPRAVELYQQAAAQGSAKAALAIAILYEQAKLSAAADYQQAAQWYLTAGRLGSNNGYLNLARLAQFGLGMDKDLLKAQSHYLLAANLGSDTAYCYFADSQIELAKGQTDWQQVKQQLINLYQYGAKRNSGYCSRQLGLFYLRQLQELDAATNWLQQAVSQGDNTAANYLQQINFKHYIAGEYSIALSNSLQESELGLAQASYLAGQMYHRGQGTERNDKQALNYWQLAQQQGSSSAEQAIILLYYQGDQTVKDSAKAEQMLQQYAAQSADAATAVADWFFYGENTEIDAKQAAKFYQLAAESGSVRAMNHLAEGYRMGLLGPADYDRAKYWYQKAAEQGYLIALHNIGEMYYYGQGFNQDFAKAKQLFERVARTEKLAESLYLLAMLYQRGQGTTTDHQQANLLFTLASNQRHEMAKFMLAQNLLNGRGTSSAKPQRAKQLLIEAAEAGVNQAAQLLQQLN